MPPSSVASSSSSSSSSLSSESFPSPEPPMILPEDYSDGGRPSSSRAFLSHAPAQGSTIEVQTFRSEYQLLVKLPGFSWDGITLATKRKRVLHVVADRWDNGGGHFERRVAFGYDADLGQVKADFDGEMLRISIPRRISSVSIMQPAYARYAPIGRST